jgi:citrate synthase
MGGTARTAWLTAWLTSDEALTILGGKRQTLYANVSRGRIRAKPDPKNSRKSLYNKSDVTRLAGRRAGRRTVAAVAAEAIGWGDPVLASGISTVFAGRLWYRGRDAIALSDSAALEDIADLLWTTHNTAFRVLRRADRRTRPTATPLQAAMSHLSERASHDPPSLGRSEAVLAAEAAILVSEIGAVMLGGEGADKIADKAMESPALHARMAAAWQVPQATEPLRRSLVLLAEHELNASTFAVRVAASTGAPLAACLLSGLATLTGPLHGGASVRMLSLAAAARTRGPKKAVGEWLAQGHAIPAFGHPLYPDGDPRARALLAAFKASKPLAELSEAVEDLTGEKPNIDFALMALADAFRLPDTAPLTIFAIARSVGWIAHLMEQVTTGSLIRPRARYIGPPLPSATALRTLIQFS